MEKSGVGKRARDEALHREILARGLEAHHTARGCRNADGSAAVRSVRGLEQTARYLHCCATRRTTWRVSRIQRIVWMRQAYRLRVYAQTQLGGCRLADEKRALRLKSAMNGSVTSGKYVRALCPSVVGIPTTSFKSLAERIQPLSLPCVCGRRSKSRWVKPCSSAEREDTDSRSFSRVNSMAAQSSGLRFLL